MDYAEMLRRALKGRSVYAASKAWGINEVTLHRYMNGQRLPDYETARIIASEAGVEPGEALNMLASEQKKRKNRANKMPKSFNDLLSIANIF